MSLLLKVTPPKSVLNVNISISKEHL